MEYPVELRYETERLLEKENLKQLASSAESISERYREKSGTGKSLVNSHIDVAAYCAVRMPATFGAVSRALELTLENNNTEINSILDAGAGTGAASFAACLATECEKITCIEREPAMIALGKQFSAAMGLETEWLQGDITNGINAKADLVITSYCLNELSDSARTEAVKRLWEATEKLLVIIDTGTPKGYQQLIKAREILLNSGAYIAAPCPHENKCALSENDWCHYTARIARTKLHKQLKGGEVPYEDEKFCFIAVSRNPCEKCDARILRHPRIDSGRITLELCTPYGITEQMVTKKDARFKTARKSECGDKF